MGVFLFAAIALIGLTVLLLLRPWKSGRAQADATTTRDLNTRLYRDQLAELDRDLAIGTLAPVDHAQARADLQRRLLEDAAQGETADAAPGTRRTSLVLAIALPVAAAGLYAWLGAPAALVPQAPPPVAGAPTAGQVEQMVADLAARLEKNPDDPKGWSILARSYHAMGRFAEAEAAFGRIGPGLERDPVLLADYADTLAERAGGRLEGKPMELVHAALRLDPDNGMALSLAATAAYQRQDFAQAATYWQRLLPKLPPESDEAKWLQKMLASIAAPGGPGASASAAASAATATTTAAATASTAAPPAPLQGTTAAAADAGAEAISGTVTLAPQLLDAVRPGDTVFVFARAVDGGRMPLAVQRARVADLPLKFKLDDAMAMSPQSRISGAAAVRIEARVSRSGNATPESGDLHGSSAPVKPGASGVDLKIDQVRP